MTDSSPHGVWDMRATPRRRGLLLPVVVALMVLAILVSLGTWQLDRKAWKEALIGRIEERATAPSGDLPTRSAWDQLAPEDWEFRRVSFEAELRPEQEALVYTVGSPLRSDIAGPGYWVFAPARLRDGSLIVVNRGFVPEGRQNVDTRRDGQVSGMVPIVGVLRWPEARGLFTPADNPDRNLWFVRDHLAIAAVKQWGPVAPFFIDQEAPAPPGGLPKPGKVTPHLPNNHLQYALTWYGLALVLIVTFVMWWRSRPSPRTPGRN